MLSKNHTLLLGLIAQKPLNPYEILHLLDKENTQNLFPIAESSVYAGIRSLYNKGYLHVERQKDSNMPEKNIYKLTENGSAVLEEAIQQYLTSLDLDTITFNLGLYFMDLLKKEKVMILLDTKRTKLEEEIQKLKKHLDQSSLPYINKAMLKHRIYLLFSEARTIRELLETIEHETKWDERQTIDGHKR